MNLPESPTKSQMDAIARQIIQSQYKDGVGAVTYKRAEGGGIEGKFKDARNPKRVFEFLIKDGRLSYGVDSWDEEDFSESLDFYDPRQPRDKDGRFGAKAVGALRPEELRTKLSVESRTEVVSDPQPAKKKTKIQQKMEEQSSMGKSAFNDAPDVLKKAIEKHGHPSLLRPEPGKSAYFSDGKGIHMDSQPKQHYPGVYRHEWGHYVDFELGDNDFVSSSPAGKRAFANDVKAFNREKYEAIVGSVLKATPKEDRDDGYSWTADIACAITKNKVGHGHSDSYYSSDENRRTEVFANIITLAGSGNPKLAGAAQALAPNMYKLAMKKLSE